MSKTETGQVSLFSDTTVMDSRFYFYFYCLSVIQYWYVGM